MNTGSQKHLRRKLPPCQNDKGNDKGKSPLKYGTEPHMYIYSQVGKHASAPIEVHAKGNAWTPEWS